VRHTLIRIQHSASHYHSVQKLSTAVAATILCDADWQIKGRESSTCLAWLHLPGLACRAGSWVLADVQTRWREWHAIGFGRMRACIIVYMLCESFL
jgi:hypothetical protein